MSQENAMQDDIVIDESGEFVAPETGHVELVFQALGDTVNAIAGTEGLTTAQIYFHGVLNASGALTYTQAVAGAEGFFANVKEGASKAIAYIKKMVKDIWGFFFKKQGPEEAKAVKAAIGETKADLESVDKVKAGLKNAAGSDSKDLVEHISKATSIGELNTLSKDVGKKNSKGQQALVVKIAQLVESLEGEIKLADEVEAEAKKSGEASYTAWATGVKSGVSGTQALVTALKGIRDLEDIKAAESTLDALKSHADVISKALEASGGTESRVQGMIDNLSKLEGNESASDEQKKEGDDNLKALQLFVKSAARYSGLLKRTLSHMKSVNTAVGKVFGV
jgi:hypothetical protein